MRLHLLVLCLFLAAIGCDNPLGGDAAALAGPGQGGPQGPGGAGGGVVPPGGAGGGPGGPGGPGGQPPVDPDDLVAAVRGRLNQANVTAIAPAPNVSSAMYELGQALAFDKELSGNRDLSCMTCHHPTLGTDDDRTLPAGAGAVGLGAARSHPDGVHIPRNSPALFNLHTFPAMFWDSRVAREGGPGGPGGPQGNGITTPAGDAITADMLAVFDHSVVSAQAMFPVTSDAEMRGLPGENELANLAADDFTGIWEGLMDRLAAIPEYPVLFESAYPGESFEGMTFAHAANAIAAFEVAAFESRGSQFQRFVAGDDAALTTRELQGAVAFFDSGCARCHSGSNLSDFQHHNTGLAQLGPGTGHGPGGNDDFGREGVTGNAGDRYRFRTTALHNVELTGPYGHAGEFDGLDEFVDHYRNPAAELQQYDITDHVDDPSLHGTVVPNTNAIIQRLSPRLDGNQNVRDADGIVEFMRSLTDPAATDLSDVVPDSVPSGLPVGD